jgi:hypothetical protein
VSDLLKEGTVSSSTPGGTIDEMNDNDIIHKLSFQEDNARKLVDTIAVNEFH